MKRILFAIAVALIAAAVAYATSFAEPVVKVYGAANTISFDGASAALPSDFELGATARASLSPHLSAVGGAFTGLGRNYIRGSVGGRITATDVDNQNFSVGLGVQYQGSNDQSIRPNEWAPDASIGLRPWPNSEYLSRAVLVAQGGYGLKSSQAFLLLGVRYEIGGF